MRPPDPNDLARIPEDLQRQFRRLERRLWWMDSLLAVCGALSCAGLSYLLLFVSDRFWDTPSWSRLCLTGSGLGGALYFSWGWLRHWVWQRRDIRALANVVQRHYRRLGDRLLGIVELADESRRPVNVSPELCRAAIRQVSAEALQFDFRQAVATRKPRLYALAALWVVALGVIPWFLAPQASWNAFARWLLPGAALPRYTFVRLQDIPSSLIVPHAEPFQIACAVRFHSLWQPKTASCRVGDLPPTRVSIAGRQVVFSIPGQTAPCQVRLTIGDATRAITVKPVLRPALKSLSARIQWPGYLQHPETERTIAKGEFSFLEGSRVAFQGETTRTLEAAQVRWQGLETPAALDKETPLAVADASFLTQVLPLPDAAQASFVWRDEWGLTSAAPWLLIVRAHPDQPPEVQCPNPSSAVAILEDEILNIDAVAHDDYGLRNLSVAWDCRKREETNQWAADVVSIAAGGPQVQALEGTFRLSPRLLKLPPETVITLRAIAQDYYPDRPPSESAPVRVFILSQEEHARLVQQELEQLTAELENLTRQQEDLKEAGRALQRLDATRLATEETERSLGEQAREQEMLSAKLQALSDKTTATLREALRNKSIPTSLLEEWARFAETMQTLAGEQMARAALLLASARQQTPDRSATLAEALEVEEEILRRLLALQREIGPALERFLANTLVQRLRQVARAEAQIGASLRTVLPETVGLETRDLNEHHRNTIQALGTDQDRAGRESRQLHQEILRFFDRTSETNYGNVAQEMQETQVAQSLADLAALIRNNVAAMAMNQSRRWEGQFNDWADQIAQATLSEDDPDGSNNSAGGAGSMSEAALRRLLALLRLRQQEENIRTYTGLLQERKETARNYREDSILLSVSQSFLIEDAESLEAAGPSRFLPQARKAMSDTERFLLIPQTDDPVVAAETDAINLLEAEIMDMLKTAQGSSWAAAMTMLMQTMGMGASPGGNLAGGSTDQANDPLSGNTRGGALEDRQSQKTIGPSSRIVPAEFREALQHYHRAVEQFVPNRDHE